MLHEKIKNYLLGVLDQNQIQFQIGDLQFQLNIEELFDKLWPNMRQIVRQTQMRAKTGEWVSIPVWPTSWNQVWFQEIKHWMVVNYRKSLCRLTSIRDETEAHYGQAKASSWEKKHPPTWEDKVIGIRDQITNAYIFWIS